MIIREGPRSPQGPIRGRTDGESDNTMGQQKLREGSRWDSSLAVQRALRGGGRGHEPRLENAKCREQSCPGASRRNEPS